MTWFTEVQETHTSYGVAPVLPFAEPASLVDHGGGRGARHGGAPPGGARHPVRRPRAALCIRSGYLALREIAGFFGFDYDDDPAPDDPISVTRDEFDEVYEQLGASGVPVQPGPRPGLARLRGLARELRRRADRAGRLRHGAVRAVDRRIVRRRRRCGVYRRCGVGAVE